MMYIYIYKKINTQRKIHYVSTFLDVGLGFIRRDNFLWGSPGVIFVHHQKVSSTPKKQNVCSRWWFQPIWKIFFKIGTHFPQDSGVIFFSKHLSPPSSDSFEPKNTPFFTKLSDLWNSNRQIPTEFTDLIISTASFGRENFFVHHQPSVPNEKSPVPRYQLEVISGKSLRDDLFCFFLGCWPTKQANRNEKRRTWVFLGLGGCGLRFVAPSFWKKKNHLEWVGIFFPQQLLKNACNLEASSWNPNIVAVPRSGIQPHHRICDMGDRILPQLGWAELSFVETHLDRELDSEIIVEQKSNQNQLTHTYNSGINRT